MLLSYSSNLAILESTWLDMDQRAMSLLFNIKEQLDDLYTDLTLSANLAAASGYNNEYSTVSISKFTPLTLGTTNHFWDRHQDSAHYNDFGSLSQSTESHFDSMHALSPQANSDLGFAVLSKSSESRSGAMDANHMQVSSNENETHSESRFEIVNRDDVVVNALDQGLPPPQLTNTALERPVTTGPYYLSTSQSTSPPTSISLSTIPFLTRGDTTQNKRIFPGASGRTSGANHDSDSAVSTSSPRSSNSDPVIRRNATQMKRALSEASSRLPAGGAHKKAKGDMDPVRDPQP